MSSLDVEGLGPDRWPIGFEQDLHRKRFANFSQPFTGTDCLAYLGVDFVPRWGDILQGRPASELAAYFIWLRIAENRFDIDAVIDANRLLGGSVAMRAGQIVSTRFKSGHLLRFDCDQEPRTFLREWLREFNKPCLPDQAIERGIWLFVDFLVAHPFFEGNGRTARLLFQAYLHAQGLMPAPLLPLSPFIFANEKAYLNALWAWEFFDQPDEFYRFMISAITKIKEVAKNSNRSFQFQF
ncbi:Fic family protein [Erythrobacter rubeus]|uniref:Fic family protein n=1 Tax=Erythrobacter rubeus TaxID=2760803 RepID=A0ABR8KKX3_9SPHN|nr:Fic family protein [Erythrobacter rubeus]MBD2840969.1 Fic family protein [Erythrobacter rubeus]